MWILEQRLPILIMGALVVAVLLGGLFQTGRRGLLYAAIVAAIGTCALLVLEQFIVTPGEQVENTLTQIAADLERNDIEAIQRVISTSKPNLRFDAEHKMKLVEIKEVSIKSNLKVEVAPEGTSAVARFNAVIRARDRAEQFGLQPFPRFFIVKFQREAGDAWRVVDYEMQDPLAKGSGASTGQ